MAFSDLAVRESLIHILSYVPDLETHCRLQRVCKLWREVILELLSHDTYAKTLSIPNGILDHFFLGPGRLLSEICTLSPLMGPQLHQIKEQEVEVNSHARTTKMRTADCAYRIAKNQAYLALFRALPLQQSLYSPQKPYVLYLMKAVQDALNFSQLSDQIQIARDFFAKRAIITNQKNQKITIIFFRIIRSIFRKTPNELELGRFEHSFIFEEEKNIKEFVIQCELTSTRLTKTFIQESDFLNYVEPEKEGGYSYYSGITLTLDAFKSLVDLFGGRADLFLPS